MGPGVGVRGPTGRKDPGEWGCGVWTFARACTTEQWWNGRTICSGIGKREFGKGEGQLGGGGEVFFGRFPKKRELGGVCHILVI